MTKRNPMGLQIGSFRDPEEVSMTFEGDQPTTRPLSSIKGRAGVDTRLVKPIHVLHLAESIAALGVIEPIVIDLADVLLAGAHRLAACKLLASPLHERSEFLQSLNGGLPLPKNITDHLNQLSSESLAVAEIPVRVMPWRATDDLDRALAVEAAENAKRRDYTASEIRSLYRRLLEAGYTDRPGRPKAGEKAARPILAAVIGKDIRRIRELLSQDEESKTRRTAGFSDVLQALQRFEGAFGKLSEVVTGASEEEGVVLIQNMVRSVRACISDIPAVARTLLSYPSVPSAESSAPSLPSPPENVAPSDQSDPSDL